MPGYTVQRFDLTDAECGGVTRRLRHFQFGSRSGCIVRPKREPVTGPLFPCAVTKSNGITYAEKCRRQGLVTPLRLPGLSLAAQHRAIGNGVPLKMGAALAAAVTARSPVTELDCGCGCGRQLQGNQRYSTAGCRKRMERRRRQPKQIVSAGGVTWPG